MPAVSTLLRPRRTIGALVSSALLSAAVAIPLLHSPAAQAAVKQTPGLTAGKTLSGVINHLGPGFTSTFAAYRNAPITAVVAYGGTDSWSSITAMGSIGWWQQVPVHHVWSMPLIPSDGSSSIAAAGAGSYDSKWVTVGQKLVAGGDANATIRLGWEMTGDWFAWNGIKNPTAWASGYRHAVTAMRSVPGQHFTFDWDPALLQSDPTQMWPGDSYVDIVSADTYDTSWAGSYAASDHVKVWDEVMNGKFGWNWLLNFNSQHGNKPIALPEWGLHYMCNGHGGGDDVNFIDQVHKFIQTHNVAFENYFDANDSSCSRFILNDSDFPKGSAEYRKLWAGNGTITPIGTPTTTPPTTTPPTTAPPTTTPPTTTPPTTTPPTSTPPTTVPPTPVGAGTGSAMMFSWSPNLSWPAALDKLSFDHNIYPYYPAVGGVKKVVFSLDGTTRNTDTAAPWAYVGTPALDPRTLTSGSHTVLATVTMSNGITVTSSATITVPSTVGIKPVVTTPPVVTTTPPAPVVTAGAPLQLSYSPDLSWPSALAGRSVDHNIYPFYPSSSSVRKVVFALDGTTINTDTAAPWAYTGATPALDPRNLTRGSHTITATVTTSAGATLRSSANFTVPSTVGR